jgi:hypothetical protein
MLFHSVFKQKMFIFLLHKYSLLDPMPLRSQGERGRGRGTGRDGGRKREKERRRERERRERERPTSLTKRPTQCSDQAQRSEISYCSIMSQQKILHSPLENSILAELME